MAVWSEDDEYKLRPALYYITEKWLLVGFLDSLYAQRAVDCHTASECTTYIAVSFYSCSVFNQNARQELREQVVFVT